MHLHVTLLTTTAPRPLTSFFGVSHSTVIPTTILTTAASYRARPDDVLTPSFQSLTYHGETTPGSGEWIVKIFSLQKRSDRWLHEAFGKDSIKWIHRKEWDSYPLCVSLLHIFPSSPND